MIRFLFFKFRDENELLQWISGGFIGAGLTLLIGVLVKLFKEHWR